MHLTYASNISPFILFVVSDTYVAPCQLLSAPAGLSHKQQAECDPNHQPAGTEKHGFCQCSCMYKIRTQFEALCFCCLFASNVIQRVCGTLYPLVKLNPGRIAWSFSFVTGAAQPQS